ncbi:MAG: erythromycin esterase family protein [Lachnospiraceae bacterium]|nr:erythromycin esterase family protein [Lachnospiraceae bacterium]
MKRKEIDPIKAEKKKKRKKINLIIDIVFIICFLLYTFGPVATAKMKIENFDNYAKDVNTIVVPEATITALGEATHGNVEFQEMKLAVFQQLVEQGYQAFALEANYGDCAVVNDWIQGGEGTLEEMTQMLSFRIYHTEQMGELLSWMREYNSQVSDDKKLRFYGFDLQGMKEEAAHILSYCRANNITEIEEYATQLEKIDMPMEAFSEEQIKELTTLVDSVRTILENHSDEKSSEYRRVIHDTEVLYDAIDMNKDDSLYSNKRDEYMAKNVSWIVEEEKNFGNTHVFISAHNGHVAKEQLNYKVMGEYLEESYGENYFVIGTDYFKTECNMPKLDGERTAHQFTSSDPLAAQVKGMEADMVYLDFDIVPETEKELYNTIHSKMYMGSLSEAYSPIMKILAYTNRIYKVPSEFYDAMILVYEATPIEIQVSD